MSARAPVRHREAAAHRGKPSVPGARTTNRPRKTLRIDLPVQSTGQITGAMWIGEEASRRALPGACVERLSDAALEVEIEPSGTLLEDKDLVLRHP